MTRLFIDPQTIARRRGAGCLAAMALLLCFACPPAGALTVERRDFVCPVGGEKFKQSVAISGFQKGQMLDLKPYGAVVAPWPLPVCPGNGFVMYRSHFSEEQVAKLKRFVTSRDYASIRGESTYYRAAKLKEFLGEPLESIADSLLKATWQATSQYGRYAREALAAYRRILSEAQLKDRTRDQYELLAGELERRLGLFAQARERFRRLAEHERFAAGFHGEIVDLQLELISRKATASRPMSANRPMPVRSTESAGILPQAGDVAEVRAQMNQAIDAHLRRAASLEREGKFAEALKILKQASALWSGEAARRLGNLYAQGKPGVAPDRKLSSKYHKLAQEWQAADRAMTPAAREEAERPARGAAPGNDETVAQPAAYPTGGNPSETPSAPDR